MNGQLRQWIGTLVGVGVFLVIAAKLQGAWIYDIKGEFAESFSNGATVAFEGQLIFPSDSVTPVTGEIEIEGETELRVFQMDMSLNLPRTALSPWDTRLYAGLDSEGQYGTMLLVNYGPDAGVGTNLLAENLDGGGGWDGWAISLADYPVGSIAEMVAVNEPMAAALAAIGFVFVVGIARAGKRGEYE